MINIVRNQEHFRNNFVLSFNMYDNEIDRD